MEGSNGGGCCILGEYVEIMANCVFATKRMKCKMDTMIFKKNIAYIENCLQPMVEQNTRNDWA